MTQALVIGGTRFIGRHTVTELRDHGYDVAIFNRGEHDDPFADTAVEHVQGDRTDDADLADAAHAVSPDVVIDCVAYRPREVRTATRVFDDVDAYVVVSSGAAYGEEAIPKREGETGLCACSDEQATDDSKASYGPRKAEGDRAVFTAAEKGVRAMSVRPCNVYGPYDYTGRVDYWIDRVANHDRVLVPGDGTNVWHRAYVEDVAAALRIVAEEGTPGEAYNVGDRRATTLDELVDGIARVLDESVEIVHAGPRELAAGDIDAGDFPLYRDYPHLLSTAKLSGLGWDSTPVADALATTVEQYVESDRDGSEYGPDREDEARVLGVLDTLA
ncbi:NAD-dependent epimerase/dehydratase family protein [Halorientalis pallida]|uniref:NAD-dependent epimerase/dehydratase family protein n=1 Tax=Halorientalis pallida TaxID=2479928 RepID=A0A498KV35_9EURY|nr:NAD-dependent epimerase/dehydratase family protein [Halorientalis pallida]RXK48419.1 NAD-dependent epimerase/dehydratase family protein [Halorientalis pallida]